MRQKRGKRGKGRAKVLPHWKMRATKWLSRRCWFRDRFDEEMRQKRGKRGKSSLTQFFEQPRACCRFHASE